MCEQPEKKENYFQVSIFAPNPLWFNLCSLNTTRPKMSTANGSKLGPEPSFAASYLPL